MSKIEKDTRIVGDTLQTAAGSYTLSLYDEVETVTKRLALTDDEVNTWGVIGLAGFDQQREFDKRLNRKLLKKKGSS